MTYVFDLHAMHNALYDAGIDEDPRKTGHIDAALEARNGQRFELLSLSGIDIDMMARIRWLVDCTTELQSAFVLTGAPQP